MKFCRIREMHIPRFVRPTTMKLGNVRVTIIVGQRSFVNDLADFVLWFFHVRVRGKGDVPVALGTVRCAAKDVEETGAVTSF
jgi:hypothetical protein